MLQGCDDLISFRVAMGNTPATLQPWRSVILTFKRDSSTYR